MRYQILKSKPTEKQMLELFGKKAAIWSDLLAYLTSHYPECIAVSTIEISDVLDEEQIKRFGLLNEPLLFCEK